MAPPKNAKNAAKPTPKLEDDKEFQLAPDNFNVVHEEETVLQFWKDTNAFKQGQKLAASRPAFIFNDGPPFATGLPHYGHILTSTIKDAVCRYASMNGMFVERRFGWDCHGLPIEHEIDKKLGIKGPEDVQKMGIKAYNQECRDIVMMYSKEWEEQIGRIGRWIDFDNDYKTMYPWFMESVWWVFKELYNKGLVYGGYKVMPYSTKCTTPVSNFEAGQNYQDVDDPAVVVSFPLDEDPSVHLLAWTTTPWTLPSNLALCVHADLLYVKVRDAKTEQIFVLMESRLSMLYKTDAEYEVLDKFAGKTLEGKTYQPLFDYYLPLKASRGCFRVLCDPYVKSDAGVGIVHSAPYFGEEDYRLCMREGIISRDTTPVCPVDEAGRFMEPVADFLGQHVKDADKDIIKHLKASGRLIHHASIRHSYPFCWRSNTPLIYRAMPSWFVRVEENREQMLANNEKTHWVPSFVKEKRFRNWIANANDWCIGRNRYWGTPIPLWTNKARTEFVCIGSIEELKRLSGRDDITDIHRDSIDDVTIPSNDGKSVLRRVTEVFDCWFESGAMPYAQKHFPFENEKEFRQQFPADFIAEGIDQTRGWFYTLLVESTLLFNRPPFKNLIVNGIVLANDGQKMSKSKKNYPDPMLVVNKFGADALRLYLINSPVVRGENMRFKEDGVQQVLKDVILPWYNAYRFLTQNVQRFKETTGKQFKSIADNHSTNMMDRWIVSYAHTLIVEVRKEMDAYRLYTVVPLLLKMNDMLCNWYVRMNRRRLKGEASADVADWSHAIHTLHSVMDIIVRLMAPITPFLCEHMYQNMRLLLPANERSASVHHASLPRSTDSLIDAVVERRVAAMQQVVDIARVIRDRKGVGLKYPLRSMVVISNDAQLLADVEAMAADVQLEMNVRAIQTTQDKHKWGVELKAVVDYRTLGLRLKGDMKKVGDAVKALSTDDLEKYAVSKSVTVHGHELTDSDIQLQYTLADSAAHGNFEAHFDATVIVLLDMTEDETLVEEGLAREMLNRMQKQRKTAKLKVSDECHVYVTITPSDCPLARALRAHHAYIDTAVKQKVYVDVALPTGVVVLDVNTSSVKDAGEVTLTLVDRRANIANGTSVEMGDPTSTMTIVLGKETVKLPLKTKEGELMSGRRLMAELHSVAFRLMSDAKLQTLLHPEEEVVSFVGRTVYVKTL